MPRAEGEPVSITVNRPSLGDLKRMYETASKNPNLWLTILWKDPKGRQAFEIVNPYRDTRDPRRHDILQLLSPKPGDEGEFLNAVVNIQEVFKNGVVPKKNTVPAAFQKVVAELNLDNL